MKFNNLKGSLILLTASLIWGLGFVAQADAAKLVPPFCMNSLRAFIASFALYLFYLFKNRKEKVPFIPKEQPLKKAHIIAFISCGLLFFAANNFQQFGIGVYPQNVEIEARSGFITALYVILVPLFSILIGKKINGYIIIAVLTAMIGVYFLCFSKGISGIYLADGLIFMCAVFYALHIMTIDKFVGVTGSLKLSIMQFLVCGIISGVLSLCLEFSRLSLENILAAALPILYLAIMSSSVAFTLQIVGQRYAEPSVASISMSFESVFAALGGWVISGKTLTIYQILGCVIMFAAIIIAQLPQFKKQKAA